MKHYLYVDDFHYYGKVIPGVLRELTSKEEELLAMIAEVSLYAPELVGIECPMGGQICNEDLEPVVFHYLNTNVKVYQSKDFHIEDRCFSWRMLECWKKNPLALQKAIETSTWACGISSNIEELYHKLYK